MKFINYIEKISGIDVYGLVSLSIFFIFFMVMLLMVFTMPKKKINEISRIPLD